MLVELEEPSLKPGLPTAPTPSLFHPTPGPKPGRGRSWSSQVTAPCPGLRVSL